MSGPHFAWQDPLEARLLPAVSAEELMGHARAIASWERESGTAGEAQAFDYIEGCLKRFGLAIERREIEAYISLPLEARIVLPDGTSLPALTHSFSTTTPPEGLEAELVEGGEGTGEALARAGATGKLALIDGFATPGKAWTAQEAGTLGQIFVSLDHLHNMIVTTIWGTPTPETASRIPRLPCCSILRADAERLSELRRGMRFAFWSGHSHGRYAGSAWYADHAWRDLERRCVLHMNVDSTGARGATDYTVFHATEDAADFAETVVADVTGQRGRARHFSRAGDQSFWGIGVPSAFMSMSQLPKQDTQFGRATERLFG